MFKRRRRRSIIILSWLFEIVILKEFGVM